MCQELPGAGDTVIRNKQTTTNSKKCTNLFRVSHFKLTKQREASTVIKCVMAGGMGR